MPSVGIFDFSTEVEQAIRAGRINVPFLYDQASYDQAVENARYSSAFGLTPSQLAQKVTSGSIWTVGNYLTVPYATLHPGLASSPAAPALAAMDIPAVGGGGGASPTVAAPRSSGAWILGLGAAALLWWTGRK